LSLKIFPGVGPDAETVENADGGKQSACPVSLVAGFPSLAVLQVGAVLRHGMTKYGPDNWRKVPRADHLNHAMMHLLAFNSGDRQDMHLQHAATRLLFALETE
jgi:hypothetical protein